MRFRLEDTNKALLSALATALESVEDAKEIDHEQDEITQAQLQEYFLNQLIEGTRTNK